MAKSEEGRVEEVKKVDKRKRGFEASATVFTRKR